jgi:hypothetical protein
MPAAHWRCRLGSGTLHATDRNTLALTPGRDVSDRAGHGRNFTFVTFRPEGRCRIVRRNDCVNEAGRPNQTRPDADNTRENPRWNRCRPAIADHGLPPKNSYLRNVPTRLMSVKVNMGPVDPITTATRMPELAIYDAADSIAPHTRISRRLALRAPERTYANWPAGPANDPLRYKTRVNDAHCVQARKIETIYLNGK